MSDLGTENTAESKKEQKRTLDRRAKLKVLLLTTTLNKSQLAQKLGVHRDTIADDINVLVADSEFWLDAQTRVSWVLQCETMLTETVEEIKMLQKRASKIRSGAAFALLQRTITDKRRFLVEMMTDMPLYRKMQNLAQFYEGHKPKHEQPWVQN